MKPILKKNAPKYNPKIDYCTMSPDGLLGCNYGKACYWHDRQYRNQIVNRQSRLVSDFCLWGNIVKEAWKVRKTSILWSWWIGNKYFLAVRLFAGKNYIRGVRFK